MSADELKKNSRLVYSTESGRIKPAKTPSTATAGSLDGVVCVRKEKKGRGGKTVTTISGLPLVGSELKALAKVLKKKCSVGGALKECLIELQGDQVEIVMGELAELGYQVKRTGG